ncbi:hypothetical protein HAV18_06380 [Burkholderia sp. D-99]|nr:hypothetical protein [Burkholderia sp. D-99]
MSTGFFLVELAQILKEFENDHEFVLCTPDGTVPQLDINGLSLPFMATDALTRAVVGYTVAPKGFAARNPGLVERRTAELELAYRHLGALPVSSVLPKTDPEAAAMRDEVVDAFAKLPTKDYLSAQEVVTRHRNPDDAFSLADFDFIHFPGGHAPMVDFRDSPWIGELINLAYEEGVVLSMICHAPVAMTSARFRVDRDGKYREVTDHPFAAAQLTTVPKHGEVIALTTNYPKIPGKKTRLEYYVDEALKEAGYRVLSTLDPAAIRLVWEPHLRLLTSNGPQSVDAQARQLRSIVETGR